MMNVLKYKNHNPRAERMRSVAGKCDLRGSRDHIPSGVLSGARGATDFQFVRFVGTRVPRDPNVGRVFQRENPEKFKRASSVWPLCAIVVVGESSAGR